MQILPASTPEREHTNTHAHKQTNSSVGCWSLSTDICVVACAKLVRSATATTQTRSPDSQTCRWFVTPEVTGSVGGWCCIADAPVCIIVLFISVHTNMRISGRITNAQWAKESGHPTISLPTQNLLAAYPRQAQWLYHQIIPFQEKHCRRLNFEENSI